MRTGLQQRYPFLRLLLPLIAGILCGDRHPSLLPVAWSLVAAGGLCVTYVLTREHRLRMWFGVAVFACIAFLGHQVMSLHLLRVRYDFPDRAVVWDVRLADGPEEKPGSLLFRADLIASCGEDEAVDTLCPLPRPLRVLLYFPKDSAAFRLKQGHRLLARTVPNLPASRGNPDEFDYARYLLMHGISGTAYVPSGQWLVAGYDSRRTLLQAAAACRAKVVGLYRNLGFRGDELAVLSALTIGERQELSDEINQTYITTGATHVLSLSGLHIGFLYALFYALCAPLWRKKAGLKPWLMLVVVLLLWAFAFITGLESPVVRSVIMFSLLALSTLRPDKPITLNTLTATAFLMLVCRPEWLFDVGFQLSFLAVAGILLLHPVFRSWCPGSNRVMRYVWGLFSVSVAAQIATAPLIVFYFSRFPTHFLLTNLWVVPLVSLVMYAAVILLLLTPFPALQGLWASVLQWMVATQNHVLQRIEHLPYASIEGLWTNVWEILLFYLCVLLLLSFYHRPVPVRLCRALGVLLLLVGSHAYSSLADRPPCGLRFYNVRGCPAVHCIEGNGSRRSWVVCADSLADSTRLQRSLAPYWNHLRLSAPVFLSGAGQAPWPMVVRDDLVRFHGQSIFLLSGDCWPRSVTGHPFRVDYLHVSSGYRGRLDELLPFLDIGMVVLDASLSAWHRRRLAEECVRLNLPFVQLAEEGCLRIDLS